MHGGRAQASLELIAILGVALVGILFFALFSSDLLTDFGVQQDTRDARDSVQGLAEAADYVYAQGEGASKSVTITIPPSAVFGANETFVGRPQDAPSSAPSNQIRIRVGETDVFAFSRAPLAGSLPSSHGKYVVNVTSRGTFVTIGAGLVSASPSAVYILMYRNQNKSAIVTFSVLTNETIVAVNLTKDWNFTSPAISISPMAFTSNGLVDMPVYLNATTNSKVAGIYAGQVNVSAWKTGDYSTRQDFALPLTVEVRVG